MATTFLDGKRKHHMNQNKLMREFKVQIDFKKEFNFYNCIINIFPR